MDELTQIRTFYSEPAPPSPEVVAAAWLRSQQPRGGRRHAGPRMLLPVGAVAAATAGVLAFTTFTWTPSARAQALEAVHRIGAQSFRVNISGQSDGQSPWYSTGQFDAARGVGVLDRYGSEQRFVGDVMYSALPLQYKDAQGRIRDFPAPYRWAKMVIKPPYDGLLYGFSHDPQRALRQLDEAEEITATGPIDGPGWHGHRYAFTTPKVDGVQAKGTLDVDRAGEIRRVNVTWSYAAHNNPTRVAHTIHDVVTFDDFGVVVKVAEPPAGQIIPADLEHYLLTGKHLPPGTQPTGWIPGP